MIKDKEYLDKNTGEKVLVLMVDDYYVHYQKDGHIKYDFKSEFNEKYREISNV